MKTPELTKYGYSLTTNPQFQSQRYGIIESLAKDLEILGRRANNPEDKNIIQELVDLILKYPSVPFLKNYLSSAYNIRGNTEKAIETNEWILKEHPEYLFARINKAFKLLSERKIEEITQILGENLELKELYPDRDLFHLSEFTAFQKFVIIYYIHTSNIELAKNRFEILKDIAPEHPDTIFVEAYMNKLYETVNEFEFKDKIPYFHHKELTVLYREGYSIPAEIIDSILSLPRETLIEDLEKILVNAIENFDYYFENEDENNTLFVLHSLLLLKELNAEESSQAVYNFLKDADEDMLEMYLGDHKTETIWQCHYVLCLNNTEFLKKVILDEEIELFCRTSYSEALKQIYLHNNQRKVEIMNIYKDVLDYYNKKVDFENEDNSELLGFVIGDIIDCNFSELLPEIKSLYEKKLVSESINGNYNSILKHLGKKNILSYKYEIKSILTIYNDVEKNWFNDYHESSENPFKNTNTETYISSEPKIGRNDPCPCGSGKKYKKCCLEKYEKDDIDF